MYRTGFLLMPAAMQTTCYVIVYFGTHMKFQIYILIHFLENINGDYKTSIPERLINNSQYQKEIKERIIFCIKRHAHIFKYTRMISLVITAGITFVLAVVTGQSVEDVTSQIFEILKELDWHCWNSENKKIYLIFLTNAQKIFKMEFSESVSINYELGV
ncbi:unnamed protein product, partial [Tenebrio molitor]